jgi:hypothetical protein
LAQHGYSPLKGERTIVQLKRRTAVRSPRHLGGEIIALSLVLLGGAAAAMWRASRRSEDALNARTWARLLPPEPPAEDGSGAD